MAETAMTARAARLLKQDWRNLLRVLTGTHRRALLALALVATAFFLPGIASLQPMDRDEPRFAQATKQMLESGDFVDIRFQQEARHKKPVGIYWAQAASVAVGEALGVDEARRAIWLYRIPSFLCALAMVLLTYWAALAFLSRQGAFLAALLMASCVLLGVEARLAKTDALLGALSVATLGFLARAYFEARAPGIAPALADRHRWLFWGVIGLAVLVKGPIVPLVLALALVVLAIRDRGLGWAKGMKPGKGLWIVGLIGRPWRARILYRSGGSFLADSVGKDMLAKVGGAQEKHGAPPGTYLGVVWLTFWPAAPLALLAAPFVWRERRDDGVALLLAWLVPFWLILEAVPTKLPHYVLPVLPALAILIVLAFERRGASLAAGWRWAAGLLIAAVPVLFAVAAPALFVLVEEGLPVLRLPFFALPFLAVAAVLGVLAGVAIVRGHPMRALRFAIPASLAIGLSAYVFGLPMLKAFNLSPRLAEAARATGCANPDYATLGYREPSLVFLTSTGLLMGTPEATAAFLEREGVGCRIAFVEKAFEPAFRAALKGASAPALATRVRGVNLNAAFDKNRRLRVLDLAVYVRR